MLTLHTKLGADDDRIQIQLQRVADVGKVELLGLQDEKI